MPAKPCKVCVNPRTHRPKWHSNPRDCPAFKEEAPPPTPPTASAVNPKRDLSAPIGTTPPPVAPKGAPPAPGTLVVSRREGQTVRDTKNPDGDKAKVVKIPPVDAAHTKEFWNGIVFAGMHEVSLLVDDWMEIDFHIDAKHFALSRFSESQVTDANPNNWYARAATKVCVIFGAKTKEQAEGYIDDFTFVSGFLGLGFVVIRHYQKAYKVSPKMRKLREANEKKRAERDAKLAALRAEREANAKRSKLTDEQKARALLAEGAGE